MNKYPAILDYLRKHLDEKRLSHTIAVAETAFMLGKHYGCSNEMCEKLYISGLLHDITKNLSISEHINVCRIADATLTEDDLASPAVLHAISGSIVARQIFPEYADSTVCRAIAYHTTGGDGMTLFDKLIYLADYIEPTRQTPACIAARRAYLDELSQSNNPMTVLNRHLLEITEAIRKYLLENQYPPHHKTDAMIEFLKNELKQ